MLSRSTDLHLIRHTLSLLCDVVDRLIEQDSRISDIEQKNDIRDRDISNVKQKCKGIIQKIDKYDTRLQEQATQLQECQESVNFVENEIPHLKYLVGRNAELECWVHPYSHNGDPICNSEEIDDF